MPPGPTQPRYRQALRFGVNPLGFNLAMQRRYGDVWTLDLLSRSDPFVVTSHPDHVRSLFTAAPEDAPSITGESPLRPIVGPNSVLTLIGPRHMQQRKLLLPPFHGEAVNRYLELIETATRREIDGWPIGKPFALAPRMQALTLDVIMGGVFGIGDRPAPGTVEARLRATLGRLVRLAANPLWFLAELPNLGRTEPRGLLRALLRPVDRDLYALVAERRRTPAASGAGGDVMSLLLQARDEDGRPMSDAELRDELLTLVLAGHETTANSLAWTVDRLLQAPAAYAKLRELTRAGSGEEYIEATIHEGMRVRPVIPLVGRFVQRPWRLGEYVVPAGTPVAISIVALHHREDVYPDPRAFRPERFLDQKEPDDPDATRSGEAQSGEARSRAGRGPGTYTWIPFGGGIRRCLGATLAMAEQRVVLREIARRVDLTAAGGKPERARQRNVTMIPRRGCRVVVRARYVA